MTRALENLNGNQEKSEHSGKLFVATAAVKRFRWRRILKTLIMLEYLIKNGGDNIADELCLGCNCHRC